MKYAIQELRVVRLRDVATDGAMCDTPENVAACWEAGVKTASWYNPDVECAVVFTLNTRRRVTGFTLVATGTLDTLLIHPREVFKLAVVKNAAAIIIAHNHPSGDPTPSEADIKVTRDLMRAGELLKIELLDHVVIGRASDGRAGWFSLRANGYFC